MRRSLAQILILALFVPSLSLAQQQQQQQQRILTPEDEQKAKAAAKPDGPRTQRPQLVLQTGQTEPAVKIAFSPDGRLLATIGFSAASIKVWEISTGRELLAIKPKDSGATPGQSMADFFFSADGRTLTSFSLGILRRWDVYSGKMLNEMVLFDEKGYGGIAQFSRDGRKLVTYGEPNLLRVWNTETGAMMISQKYQGNKNNDDDKDLTFVAVAFSPDGSRVAAIEDERVLSSTGSQIVVRDTNGGKILQTITLKEAASQKEQIRVSQKSARKMMEEMMKGNTTVAAPAQNGAQNYLAEQTAPARGLAYSPDGRFLAFISDGAEVRLFDNGKPSATVSLGGGVKREEGWEWMMSTVGNALTFSSDARVCFLRSGRRDLKMIEPVSGRSLQAFPQTDAEVMATALSPDGRFGASSLVDGSITIWNLAGITGSGQAQIVRTFNSSALPVGQAVFSPDGRSLITNAGDGVSIWELNTGTSIRTLSLPQQKTRSVREIYERSAMNKLTTDGKIYLKGDKNGVKFWDARSGQELRSVNMPGAGRFGKSAISRDGGVMAVGEEFKPSTSAGVAQTAAPTQTQSNNPSQDPLDAPVQQQIDATDKDKTDKDKKKKKAPGAGGFGGFGGFGGIGGLGRSGGRGKADTKEINRINKEMEKKQGEMEKAMENGDMAKVSQLQKEIGELSVQMMKASGISEQDLPFPIPQMPQTTQTGAQTTTQNSGRSPGSLMERMMPKAGIRLVEMSSGRETQSIKGQDFTDFYAQSLTLSPDGKILACAFNGFSVKLIDAAAGKELSTMTVNRGLMTSGLVFSQDGRLLASSHMELRPGASLTSVGLSMSQLYVNNIRVWDISDPIKGGREIRNIATDDLFPNMAFSPDGKMLAVGMSDIRVFDVASGSELSKLTGNTTMVSSIGFSPDGKSMVTSSEDGSTRLWNTQTGEHLVTLVTLNEGADWLVVTPDGLFDGTPGAWNQILWRFSNNIFDVTPVEVYFNEFFYPGLLSDVYSGKRPRAAQDVALKDRRQPVVKITRADGQSSSVNERTVNLTIEVAEPESSGVSGGANGLAGGRDLRLFRNGTLVKAWRGDLLKGQKRVTFDAKLPIVAGENRLTAYAFNRDNVKSPDSSLVVNGGDGLRRKGTAYILAVGVNHYANKQYDLKYAAADATAFAEEFRTQQMKLQQFERVEVVTLLDQDATKANILLALKRLAGAESASGPPALKAAQPEDAVILFFAGHGTSRGSRFYLVPHDLGYTGPRAAIDAQAVKTILEHSISDSEIESAVEGLDASQLIFVIDACNSGQALEAEEKRRGPMNSKGLAQLAYEKGMYILTAAQSYQAALEAAELGHGYLSFALIEEGLKKGMADRDEKDGKVLVREWFNYATERVPQMQEKEMGTRLLLDFVENDAKAKDPKQRSIQRPRVFYRRELESRPLIVAKP